MTVSVIVPTYNGRHKLPNILRALEQQTFAADEVLVVIDGSTDGTAEYLASESWQLPGFRVVEQRNQGRAVVRNYGAQQAQGQLLIFFDDDMRPEPECVAEHVAHHAQYAASIAVGVQVEDYTKMTTDFQHFKAFLSRKWMQEFVGQPTQLINAQRPFITAANCSLPKAVFEQLAGFDATLTDAEDFDLAMRASEAGIPIYFLNNAKAWHDDFVSCASYVKRLREYKKAHQQLAATRPALFQKYTAPTVPPSPGLKSSVFALFNHPSWITLIDSGKLTAVLPQKARYKLYDVVMTALSTYHAA
jgi:glycosyltransferase involved in cell wall biosynthesis